MSLASDQQSLDDHEEQRDEEDADRHAGDHPAEHAGADRTLGAGAGATRDREGFFQAARGGTLFLDELGEAPPDVQAMLLRVLETGEMYPVGASAPIAVDVRPIAAADANLWVPASPAGYGGALIVTRNDLDLLDDAIPRVIHLAKGTLGEGPG